MSLLDRRRSRRVQFHGFHHELQTQNVHFVETSYFKELLSMRRRRGLEGMGGGSFTVDSILLFFQILYAALLVEILQ